MQVAGSAEEQQDWQGDLSTGCTQALFMREVGGGLEGLQQAVAWARIVQLVSATVW
jgi:hypothetical protein